MDKIALTKSFNYPIPGQSLTSRPGNARWEQPAEMSSVDEVADFFWERITSPSVFRDLMRMLDAGVPINLIVSSIVMNGAMQGKYNLDMVMLITPILAIQIANLAKMAGANVKVMDKKDLGVNPAPLAKMFSKQTNQSSIMEDVDMSDEDSGLLSNPKGIM